MRARSPHARAEAEVGGMGRRIPTVGAPNVVAGLWARSPQAWAEAEVGGMGRRVPTVGAPNVVAGP